MHSATTSEPSNVSSALADEPQPSSHLIQLPGGIWSLWRWSVLRGTGFPAANLLRLSLQSCAADADALQEAGEEVERVKNQALDVVRSTLDELRRKGEWENAEKRNPLLKAMRDLNRGMVPPHHLTPEAGDILEILRAALARRDDAQAKFHRAYEEMTFQTSCELHNLALDKRFQEAIIWQNRNVFQSAIAPLLLEPPTPGKRNSKRRQKEELVATYLQRYCAKNESIGFFGPVVWTKLVADGRAFKAEPGPDLLASRTVYLETWCIDVLAEQLGKNIAIRPWTAPRLLPYMYLDGTMLIFPLGRTVRVTAVEAAALRACDGRETAQEVVAGLMRDFPTLVKSEARGFQLLQRLCDQKLIVWDFIVPSDLNPHLAYRRLLERIKDERLREAPMKALDELEEGRRTVARAAGNPAELNHALGQIESSFVRSSGVAATRSAGKTYAARTIIYEDCRRDTDVEVGAEVLGRLGPPLSLLLTSARWFTYQVAEFYRRAFLKIYTEIARQKGSATIDASAFWYRAYPTTNDKAQTAGAALMPVFQQRWAEVLSIKDNNQRRLRYSVEQLRRRVMEVFEAPRAGWSMARYHSPDVMIAAQSVEAIRRGDYELVLGEMHMGRNTLMAALFVDQHPHREELCHAVECDLPEDGIRMASPKYSPAWTARLAPALYPPKNYRLVASPDSFCDDKSKALPVGELVIERQKDDLIVRTRDGRLKFKILEALADTLSNQTMNYFKIMRADKHTPRINIDRLVVAREAWTFTPPELSFAFEKEDTNRFLAARRWARAHGLPNFVFVKSAAEAKPFYIDLSSPIYVNIFAKAVRRTSDEHSQSSITISEMYPGHDQSWLPDAAGQRYASEFRIVAVDPEI